jgi:hypothetical protein
LINFRKRGFRLAEMAKRKKEGSSGVELVDLRLVQLVTFGELVPGGWVCGWQ